VSIAASGSWRHDELVSVPIVAVRRIAVPRQPVYDLTVDGPPEFLADGVLIHNCQWDPDEPWSPDRLDGMVWSVTALAPWKSRRPATTSTAAGRSIQ
jgi:hypothetical protein